MKIPMVYRKLLHEVFMDVKPDVRDFPVLSW